MPHNYTDAQIAARDGLEALQYGDGPRPFITERQQRDGERLSTLMSARGVNGPYFTPEKSGGRKSKSNKKAHSRRRKISKKSQTKRRR